MLPLRPALALEQERRKGNRKIWGGGLKGGVLRTEIWGGGLKAVVIRTEIWGGGLKRVVMFTQI